MRRANGQAELAALVALSGGLAAGTGVFIGSGSTIAALCVGVLLGAGGWSLLASRRKRPLDEELDEDTRPIDPADEPLALVAERTARQLEVAQAEAESAELRIERAEATARQRMRLLEEVARVAVPELESMQEALAELMHSVDPALADRRGAPGQLAARLQRLRLLLDDLLALGEIDAAGGETARPVPCDLGELARQAAGEGAAVAVDATVPSLLVCDRAAVVSLLGSLVEHLRRSGGPAPRVELSARPERADLVTVALRVSGGPGFTEADREVISGAGTQHALERYGDDGGAGLRLSLAARALERLAGRLLVGAEDAVTVELLTPVGVDRRRRGESSTAREAEPVVEHV
jgi:signal transduction histidine kinase